MLKVFSLFTLSLFCSSMRLNHHSEVLNKEMEDVPTEEALILEHSLDGLTYSYVNNAQLYQQGWSELVKPHFWKMIMHLPADSCVLNVANTREIIELMSVKEWEKKTSVQKDNYRDSVRLAMNLDKEAGIYMTTGKHDFYNYEGILPLISQGVEVFKEREVDPWYAQAILMIESPGRLAKSNAGAYGAFQLMPGVARNMGMTVNKYTDDRKDFHKSAVGASKLIETICLPEARKILEDRAIEFQENDLWFRLFVLHIYHAGAYNVAQVVNKIHPQEGGMGLIQEMWQTKSARFGNASQNYSQIALAAMLILDDMLWDCYQS